MKLLKVKMEVYTLVTSGLFYFRSFMVVFYKSKKLNKVQILLELTVDAGVRRLVGPQDECPKK